MADTSRHLDLPRGFHDCDPGRTALYQAIRHDWFTACALAGYQPVEVPPVGFQDTFTRGHHAAGNRLYPFPDRSGRDLALVSDSLPAVLPASCGCSGSATAVRSSATSGGHDASSTTSG